MSRAEVFDTRPCALGEGPLWVPEHQRLYWFDITGRRMLARGIAPEAAPLEWHFDEMHSAAARLDDDHLLLASETGLWRFAPDTGARELICALEADNPVTRSNDGRADPQGGFWIGTMGKSAEAEAGSIWRWYRGELRCLFAKITITNAICFTPDGAWAYFCDTAKAQVMKVALDPEGWPAGAPQIWLDLAAEGLNPDGAIVDATGHVWVAQWGASRVAVYAPDASFVKALTLPAPHASCPAFGGPDLSTLYCTTALQGMSAQARADHPQGGMTFAWPHAGHGQPEHKVVLEHR